MFQILKQWYNVKIYTDLIVLQFSLFNFTTTLLPHFPIIFCIYKEH